MAHTITPPQAIAERQAEKLLSHVEVLFAIL